MGDSCKKDHDQVMGLSHIVELPDRFHYTGIWRFA